MKLDTGRAKFTAQAQWIMCVVCFASSEGRLKSGVEKLVETGNGRVDFQ